MQFLMEGARLGESVLYLTLSETREELLGVARSHGWSLAIQVRKVDPGELSPGELVHYIREAVSHDGVSSSPGHPAAAPRPTRRLAC